MKKSLALLFLIISAAIALGNPSQDPDNPLPIPIGNLGADTGGSRAPILIPIECYYYPSLSSVLACFQYSIGTVDIAVKNLDSGAVSNQNVNGTAGIHMIAVSNSPGLYSITFTLSDGSVYGGTYTII